MANVNNKNDNNNEWDGNVYVYKGGKVNENDKRRIEHVRIDEAIAVIHDQAFFECEKLQTIKLKENNINNVKKIGEESFRRCYNLLSIDLQNTQIESIGNDAFSYCHKLVTVQFPATVRNIEEGCFAFCTQLKVVDLLHVNYLESIEEYTFSNCYALQTVNLPPTTSCIGNGSFLACKALETLDLRVTCVEEIGEKAFYHCTNLTNVYFPTTTKSIGQYSFCGCKKLAYLDLQATSIERIGDYALWECINLKTINFPKTLRYIGRESFEYCRSLEYLNLQETSIEKIGDGAFKNCIHLKMVVGICTSHREKQLQEIMDSESFQLPASLVEIGEDAFFYCANLRNNINNNWLQYELDLNRGGRKFLQRDHHQDNDGGTNEDNDGGDANKRHGKVYSSSLWPLILHRVMNEMELPKQTICPNDDNLSLYTEANPVQRCGSVFFYFLVHGVIADLQPQAQSGNVLLQAATQTQAAASTSSFSGLAKKRKAEW